MEDNPRLKASILEVVDNQIESNDPPETRMTFNRLTEEGFSESEAKELIATVAVSEIFGVLKKNEPFDLKRFVTALNMLPNIPGD